MIGEEEDTGGEAEAAESAGRQAMHRARTAQSADAIVAARRGERGKERGWGGESERPRADGRSEWVLR